MRLEIDTGCGEARLIQADNFKALDAILIETSVGHKIFPHCIRMDEDGKHAWVAVTALKERGCLHDPDWTKQFDEMIAYARSKAWIDASGEMVRVHIATT